MNRTKQGRYAAASGLRIHSPEWLPGIGDSTVLVMTRTMWQKLAIWSNGSVRMPD